MDWLWGPFTVPFMGRALLALTILSVAGGVVSVFVLLRRLAFAADTLTHTVFPGVVLGFVLRGESGVLWGAFVAAMVTAVALTVLTRLSRVTDDTALAVLLTAMFSVGVVLVSRRASYTSDLTSFLFGRVLTVTAQQVTMTAVIAAVAVVLLAATAKEQLFRAFDPRGAQAAGFRLVWLDLALNLVVALVVVAAVRAVGVLLVISFLVAPAAAARLLTSRLWALAVGGCAVAWLSSVVGLLISYHASVGHGVRLSAGPTVVLTMSLVYVAFVVVGWARRRVMARTGRRRRFESAAGRPMAGALR